MLENLYLISGNDKTVFANPEITKKLESEKYTLEIIYHPRKIKKEWLSENALVVTDDEGLLHTFQNVRANVAFCSFGDIFPWNAQYILHGVESLDEENALEAYNELTHATRQIAETKRLIIRESKVSDVDDFYRIYAKPGMTDYTEALFPDPEDEKKYMADYIREIYGFYGYGIWTVISRETGEIIGRAGVTMREGYDYPEIGYVIDKDCQGRGLAYEACKAIIEYTKTHIETDRILALSQRDNVAGNGLLLKLGFTCEEEVMERGILYQKYCLYLA